MTKRNCVVLLTLFALAGSAAAGDYDFFDGARYPGPIKKPGVDLYKVTSRRAGSAADPKAYERREVVWWPRKGVDIIEVKKGMPLRTWTRRGGKEPRAFKAHLIGFRGIGNKYGDPFRGTKYYCPAVVLRLADGRKRCFTRNSLVEADEKWILDLYLKEMARLRKTLCKVKYELRPGTDSRWPNNAKPGEPGTMRVESEHFVWVSGSQQAPNERHSPWVNKKEPAKARLHREGATHFAEHMWAYQEHAGVLMPYWDRHQKYKYEVTCVGTYRDGHKWLPGYAGGGYGGCGIKHGGGGPWSGLLMHEWGHGLIMQGGVHGEILADSCAVIDDPAGMRHHNNVSRPWRCCIHGAYRTCLLYAITGQDPNWGYAMAITLPAPRETSVFQRLARLGEQRGLFADGIRGAGDVVGDFAARLAEFDCELQENLRRAYTSVKRNYLEAVDRKAGLYRSPWSESPEPFGANVIRLVPEKDAKAIAVDFRGFHDPDTYGDWRACIVAVDNDGKCRYSPLWNKGVMEMKVRPDDSRFWLTVAATPTALQSGWSLYVGRHAYRYPYEVKLTGCRPGTPHKLLGDKNIEDRRHPNGGGWVAASAKVAPTAYVAPDAMVLDGAKVLDHAAIEDYAVVRGGGVTVSGHAKVAGQAEVTGNATIDGYTRVLHPFKGKKKEDAPHELPLRVGQDKGDGRKLWVNYAMDREETEVLEDWFRNKDGDVRIFFLLNLNGHLYGRPEFVVEDGHRGFRFDGKTQYAEATPHLADLGEITIDIGLKWEGGKDQAVFDFGSSVNSRMVLTAAGASGKVELAITRAGKTERVVADAALPTGKWVLCRVEIDGKKIALWIDGRKAAQKASGFRPADVYPAGAEKRNFIAAARNVTGVAGHFKGSLDHLRVHYKVYEDFAKAPAPRRHAPRRISREFIDSYRKATGNARLRAALVDAKRRPVNDYYQKTRGVMQKRIREIDEGSEAVAEARRKVQQLEQKLNQHRDKRRAEFEKLPETIKQRAECKKLEDQARALETELREVVKALEAKYKAENKAVIEADEKALAAVREKQKQAESEMKRLEETFKALPEIAKLKDESQRNVRLAKFRVKNAEYGRWVSARAEAEAEARKIGQRSGKRHHAAVGANPQIAKLNGRIRSCRARIVRPDSSAYAARGAAELTQQIVKAKMVVDEAIKENMARHSPERSWLGNYSRSAFSGYYNYPYHRYIHKWASIQVGGGEEPQEDLGKLEHVYNAQVPDKWHTKVDWQWRLRWELDGSIDELPLVRQWLERARGPVVTEKPVGGRK